MAVKHPDRKSTRLNSSHTEIYALSLHDALPICSAIASTDTGLSFRRQPTVVPARISAIVWADGRQTSRSEEHTSELQSHRDLRSFPTRRSSDLFSDREHRYRPELPATTDGSASANFGDRLGGWPSNI